MFKYGEVMGQGCKEQPRLVLGTSRLSLRNREEGVQAGR